MVRSSGKTKAVILCRVSTAQQGEDGVSLEMQETACRALAEQRGLLVVGVVQETISGRKEACKRPGLTEALELVKAHDAVLVAYSISRIARSTRIFLNLIDPEGGQGVPVLSVSEPYFDGMQGSMGKMLVSLLSIFAEWEAEVIRERTKAALAELKRQGRRLGAPRAYESRGADGEIVVDPAKVKLLRYVQQLAKAQPEASQRELAAFLNFHGVPSVMGKKWWQRSVGDVLKAELPRVPEEVLMEIDLPLPPLPRISA